MSAVWSPREGYDDSWSNMAPDRHYSSPLATEYPDQTKCAAYGLCASSLCFIVLGVCVCVFIYWLPWFSSVWVGDSKQHAWVSLLAGLNQYWRINFTAVGRGIFREKLLECKISCDRCDWISRAQGSWGRGWSTITCLDHD